MKKYIFITLSIILLLTTACNKLTYDYPVTIIVDDEQPPVDSVDYSKYERGGALSLAICNFDTLNPILTKSSTVADAMKLVFEPLFTLDSKQSAVPVLATGYTVSDDATAYTISLRNDISWHDGKYFDSEDVEYTINAIKNNDSVYNFNTEKIASHYAIDKYTYFIKLSEPVANFVSILDFPIVKANSDMEPENTKYVPVGTGPYKYSTMTGMREVTLMANGSWRGDANPAYIDKIVLKVLPSESSASFSFDSREVEVLTDDVAKLYEYVPKSNAVVHTYTSNAMCFLGINFYNSVFWGKSTRQALQYVIDKEEIVNNILLGHARIVEVPLNPQSWLHDGRSRVYYKDTAKSRELLEQDGWKYDVSENLYRRNLNGEEQTLQLKVLVNKDNSMRLNVAKSIVESLKEAGWSATVKEVEFDEYIRLINEKDFDVFVGDISMAQNMDLSFLLGSSGNYFTYGSNEMDRYLLDAKTASNSEGVKRAYADIANLFTDDVPFVPIYFAEASLIYDFKIDGLVKPTVNNPYNDIHLWYVKTKNRR